MLTAILLACAVAGPIDYQARYDDYLSRGLIEEVPAADADIHLTLKGCTPQPYPPESLKYIGTYRIIGGVKVPRRRMMGTGILTAVHQVRGPSYGKYIRVRITCRPNPWDPTGTPITQRLMFAPIGSIVRIDGAWPTP